MKNSVADRSNAQTSCAAQFIGNNIEVCIATTILLLATVSTLVTNTVTDNDVQ